MKKITIIFFTLISVCINAQETIPQPEFDNRPYYLLNDKLENLDREKGKVDTKIKGMGFGGADLFYSVFKEKSEVRFKANDLPRIFMSFDTKVDPSEIIVISKAELIPAKRKSSAKLRFQTMSMGYGGKAKEINSTFISFEVKKIRDGLYEIIFPDGILPGEYAFMPIVDMNNMMTAASSGVSMTCFGID